MIIFLLAPALLLMALLGYVRHSAAVALLAAFLPVFLIRFDLVGIPTNAFEAAVLAVALAGACNPHVRRSWRTAGRKVPKMIVACVLLFVLASILSAAVSPHLSTSLGILKGWIIVPLLFGWLVFTVSRAAEGRRAIERALLASALAVAVIGLSQVTSLPRVRAIYDVPNSLALFLAPVATFAWWRKKYPAALILTAAAVATRSTAALAAVGLAPPLGAVIWGKQRDRKMLGVTLLVTVLAALYIAATHNEAASFRVRQQLWSISFELIRENPILGIGLGTFEPAYQQKLHERFAAYESRITNHGSPPPMAEFVFRDPHNWLLSFWLNTGLLGLASFTVLNGYVLWQTLSPRSTSRESQGLALALISLLLFGLVDTIFWKNDLAALQWLLLALLLNQIRADREQNNPGE